MAVIGRPYPLFYLSKNGLSGITPIVAKIRKPDGTFIGPITLTEIAEPGFEGRYSATINTSEGSDPVGDYLVAINEPDGFKAIHRINFESASSGGGVIGDIGINRRSVLEAEVRQSTQIEAMIIEKDVIAESLSNNKLEATFYRDDLDYFLDNQNIEGAY